MTIATASTAANASAAFNYAEHEKQLRKLFELAEDNQLAVQDAIACLSAEREALAKERMALAKASVNSAEVSDTLRKATAEAIPAIAAAADKSVQAAMERAMQSQTQAQDTLRRTASELNDDVRRTAVEATDTVKRTASEAVPAIERAADRVIKDSMERALGLTQDAATRIWSGTAAPVVERFTTVTHLAHEMESRIRRAGYRHAWQWTALTALGVIATVVVAVVGVQQIKAQQAEVQRQQAELAAQKQAFSEEMARMQASVTFLEKKGGRVRMDKCGPEQRLCIEVTSDQGTGRGAFRGPWADAKNERTFVIPRGY
jgi:hypothetical protein